METRLTPNSASIHRSTSASGLSSSSSLPSRIQRPPGEPSSHENCSTLLEAMRQESRNFCELLACMELELIPIDLFARACSSKKSWSPNGETFEKQPDEAAVPAWLLTLFGAGTAIREGHVPELLSQAQELEVIQFVTEDGIRHVKLREECRTEIYREMQLNRRLELLSESTAIAMHAFPCKFAELLGEEMESRLLPVMESCILPLLAVVTDDDITSWLTPRQR
jgi:hypothetical protein